MSSCRVAGPRGIKRVTYSTVVNCLNERRKAINGSPSGFYSDVSLIFVANHITMTVSSTARYILWAAAAGLVLLLYPETDKDFPQ